MWSLRVRATSSPSGATTIAVLKPSPSSAVGPLVERGVDVDAGLRRHRGGELGRCGRPAAPPARRRPPPARPGRPRSSGDRVSSCRQTSRAPSRGGQLRFPSAAPPRARRDRGASAAARRRSGTAARSGGRVRAGESGTPVGAISRSSVHPPTVARSRTGRRQSPEDDAPYRSTRPPPPTASACRPSSSRTTAAGWSGPSGPTTGATAPAPAQEAFAAVASAIAASEPVTMAVSDGQFERARAALPDSVRVVELSTDDAWMRDTGPTFVVDGSGRAARRRLALQRLGRPRRRALLPLGPRRTRRRQGARGRGRPTATGRRWCSRAARSTSTARARC